ncbi:hypothetical protein QBC45DRAFT_407697 [Copromyces sp. CBS 386.78]|nr:hypothetical protein QBC45DRAFT_407697 [Copromyces sp. CBS 386.78]
MTVGDTGSDVVLLYPPNSLQSFLFLLWFPLSSIMYHLNRGFLVKCVRFPFRCHVLTLIRAKCLLFLQLAIPFWSCTYLLDLGIIPATKTVRLSPVLLHARFGRQSPRYL